MPEGKFTPDIPFLLAAGGTQYRPLASSHYVASPVQVQDEQAYLPSDMSKTALLNGLQKYRDDIKIIPETLLDRAAIHVSRMIAPFWGGDPEENVTSYPDAVASLDFTKSSGWPWYFKYPSKGEALAAVGDQIMMLVHLVLSGIWVLMIFAMTLKDELRPYDRVKNKKTRVFNASDIVHLITSKMMFQKQNDKLMNSIGHGHPSTIGITVPGPQYTSTVLNLGESLNDGDGDGCDARYNLCVARKVRDLRSEYLPSRYKKCVHILYSAVYAGLTCVLGWIYWLVHQKSGWENTGMDNVFQYWFGLVMFWIEYQDATGHILEFDEFIKLILNGDDILVAMGANVPITFEFVCQYMKVHYNICIEADNWLPRPPTQVVFLSHHLRLRWVPEFGDVYVAAGNLPKLLSSINWFQKNPDFLYEESVLMHLLGVRINLWPWEREFDDLEEQIDKYLMRVPKTRRIDLILRARISSKHIAMLHLRHEACVFYASHLDQVLKDLTSPDKDWLHLQSSGGCYMSLPYHGNYVGPGWSAGKFQSSVVDNTVRPIDKFDEAARDHDASYFNYPDNPHRADADWKFVRDTKGLGSKAELARSLVAIQALGRDTYSYMTGQRKAKGGKTPKKQGKKVKRQRSRRNNNVGARRVRAPVVSGIRPSQLANTNTAVRTQFKATSNGMQAHCEGTELIGSLTVNTADVQGKVLLFQNIGPQFLSATRLQAYAAMFEKYRYRTCELILRSKCSNSTNGSVVAYFERDVAEVVPAATPDTVQRAAQTWGASDVPVKTDGRAFMKRLPDENPYFTDLGASTADPAFGQANAVVQLNSSGTSVISSGSLTTHDLLLRYSIDFWVPQLQQEVLLFYTFVQPSGTGLTTSLCLGTVASIEAGGNLAPPLFNGANIITLAARYGHYYKAILEYAGTTIAGTAINVSSNATTITNLTSDASDNCNIVSKNVTVTDLSLGVVQNVTFTFGAGTVTSPTFAAFTIYDYGTSFNPSNPIAGPSGPSSSKWIANARNKEKLEQTGRMLQMEAQLNAFRKQLEMIQYESNFGFGSTKPQLTPIPEEQEEDDFVEHFDEKSGKFVSTAIANKKLEPCRICGMRNPDHIGSQCPKQAFPLPDCNNRRTKN